MAKIKSKNIDNKKLTEVTKLNNGSRVEASK